MVPELQGIDHFHLYVPNKVQAASWYADNLGFRITEAFRSWDTEDGPLTIEDASGAIHLALFARQEYAASTSIAFRCSGPDFLAWKRHLEEKQLLLRCTDHNLSWSLYFQDAFGHQHEITTYDVGMVSQQITG